MEKRQLRQAEYMARRSLGLLLTRASTPRTTDLQISFEPEVRSTPASPQPILRIVLYLMGTWLAQKGLFHGVLPFWEDRHTWVYGDSDPATELAGSGRVDWQKTLAHMARGADAPILRSRWRVREEAASRLLAEALDELVLHVDELLERFAALESPIQGALAEIIGHVEKNNEQARLWLAEDRLSRFRMSERIRGELRRLYARELDREDGDRLFGLYRDPARQLIGPTIHRRSTAALSRRLEAWREQYLDGHVWFADRAGVDLAVGHLDGLYELWCFAELLTAGRRMGLENMAQRSFLRRGSGQHAFDLGADFYAYYDFGARAFRNLRADQVFAGNVASPTLPGARVEWFLRHAEDYRQSLVIDTKYYTRWDSGQALKVMGYMQNFGVHQGAVIFAGDLSPLANQVEPVIEGLFRLPCPTEAESRLWVLQLDPRPRHEQQRFAVLSKFLQESMLRSP